MRSYISLLAALVVPALAEQLDVRGGGGDDGWGSGTTTDVIYTTSMWDLLVPLTSSGRID